MPSALAFAAGAAVMLLFLQPAHADPLVTVTPTGLELSWQAWLIAVAAAVGGGLTILDKVLAWLKWLAPRTETKLDDRARDVAQVVDDAAHAKLDNILKLVGGLIPATGVPVTASDKPAAPALNIVPPPGSSGAALLVVLLLGALAAPALTGCTATQARQTAAVGVVAALDCEAQHFDAAVMADLRALADARVQAWISGKAPADLGALTDRVKADLAALKSDTGHCALAGALAAATAIASQTPGEAAQGLTIAAPARPDPAAVRAAFQVAARELGWAPVKVAGGTVL